MKMAKGKRSVELLQDHPDLENAEFALLVWTSFARDRKSKTGLSLSIGEPPIEITPCDTSEYVQACRCPMCTAFSILNMVYLTALSD